MERQYCSLVRNQAMPETVFTIYVTDPDTGLSAYQCETTDEDRAQDEVDRLNGWLARAGRPCTAHYIP